jgi:hypothetical protein
MRVTEKWGFYHYEKRKKQQQWTEWFTGKEIFGRWFSRTLAGCNGSQGKWTFHNGTQVRIMICKRSTLCLFISETQIDCNWQSDTKAAVLFDALRRRRPAAKARSDRNRSIDHVRTAAAPAVPWPMSMAAAASSLRSFFAFRNGLTREREESSVQRGADAAPGGGLKPRVEPPRPALARSWPGRRDVLKRTPQMHRDRDY